MDDYNKLWKALDVFALAYREKGGFVPQEIVDDLKSAKTLINI